MIILNLFLAFLTIGMVSFGGGYAMLPLFERMVVVERNWISMERFVDMIAISQVTPGPIAINSATFIGYQTAIEYGLFYGIMGSMFSTIGVVFIPVLLVLVIGRYHVKFKESKLVKSIFIGLRPVLVGLIFASVFSVANNAIFDVFGFFIILGVLVLLVRFRLHPILVIFIAGFAGMIIY